MELTSKLGYRIYTLTIDQGFRETKHLRILLRKRLISSEDPEKMKVINQGNSIK